MAGRGLRGENGPRGRSSELGGRHPGVEAAAGLPPGTDRGLRIMAGCPQRAAEP
jgi:hypothetical protein